MLLDGNRFGDLLDAHASGCHPLERTILVVRILLNTRDLRQMKLWCMELVSSAWLCVGVRCGKTFRFVAHVLGEGERRGGEREFSSKTTQIEHFNDGFGLHFSIRRFLGNKKSPMPRTQKNKGPKAQKGPELARHPAHNRRDE